MSVEPHYTKLSDEEGEVDSSQYVEHAKRQWRRRFWILLFTSCLTQFLWIALIIKQTPSSCHPFGEGVELPYCKHEYIHCLRLFIIANVMQLAPARSALRYENRYPHKDPDTPRFMGKPREEMDEAWHELLNGNHGNYV